MIIMFWTAVKNDRTFAGHNKLRATHTMWRTSLFTSKTAMVFDFYVTFILFNFFLQMIHWVASWYDFNSFSVNGNIFFLSKLITSAACSLKGIQNFFIQSFPQQKLCLFSIISNVHIFYIEYPQKYVHLFLLLKISLDYYLDLQKLFVVIDLISYIG